MVLSVVVGHVSCVNGHSYKHTFCPYLLQMSLPSTIFTLVIHGPEAPKGPPQRMQPVLAPTTAHAGGFCATKGHAGLRCPIMGHVGSLCRTSRHAPVLCRTNGRAGGCRPTTGEGSGPSHKASRRNLPQQRTCPRFPPYQRRDGWILNPKNAFGLLGHRAYKRSLPRQRACPLFFSPPQGMCLVLGPLQPMHVNFTRSEVIWADFAL